MKAGLRPDMVNRGEERGRYAAELLGLRYLPLSRFIPEEYSLIVHATPLRDEAPFPVDRLGEGTIVLDMGYGAKETALVAEARAAHGKRLLVVDGWAVLTIDAAHQFETMTGHRMPIHDARVVLRTTHIH